CQLRRANEFRARRAQVAAWYDEALADIAAIERPQVGPDVEHAWHLYAIRLRRARLSIDRNQVIERLRASGIASSVHWLPLHMHPYYRQTYGYRPEDFPVAAAEYPRLISLPIFPRMTREQVQRVAD